MQLVPLFAILLSVAIMPTNSRKAQHSTTFLSSYDFDRAQNMTFEVAESAPMPIPLSNRDLYYEGDMMIQESDENKVAMYTAKRWPKGRIPYIMENHFSAEERAAIARGIMLLQERTCIRFVPKKASDKDYVLMKRGQGCAAHVGRLGGQQWVILGTGCYGIETVTHELMHSVGFIHEQSRPDRDEHVEIIWDNIKPSAKRNFKKHDHDYLADHGFPYDLMSVMHYRQYAFSKNRKPTILPKRPVPHLRCRGLDCPSELDIKKINFLYKCGKDDYDDEDEEVDGFGEKDIDNEVNVDAEMLIGKNRGRVPTGGQFEDIGGHHRRPCMDEEDCYRRGAYKKHLPIPYPHVMGLYEYDQHHHQGGNDHLMNRLYFRPRHRFFARHRPPVSLFSPLVQSFF